MNMNVIVVLGSDDELVAAALASDVPGDPEPYFQQLLDQCERWSIGRLEVPASLVEALVAHGTSDQEFSDGYEGQGALAKAVPDQMVDEERWTKSEPDEEPEEIDQGDDCPHCGGQVVVDGSCDYSRVPVLAIGCDTDQADSGGDFEWDDDGPYCEDCGKRFRIS